MGKSISIKVMKRVSKEISPNCTQYDMEEIELINRIPFNRGFIGNFVPHYCRYQSKVHLIRGSIDYSYMHGFDNDAYIVID